MPIDRCQEFEERFLKYIETAHPEIGRSIQEARDITEDTEETLKAAINEFKATFKAT